MDSPVTLQPSVHEALQRPRYTLFGPGDPILHDHVKVRVTFHLPTVHTQTAVLVKHRVHALFLVSV